MLKVVAASIRGLTLFCIRSTRLFLINTRRKKLNTKATIMAFTIGGALLVLILSAVTPSEQTPVWGYRCESRLCLKKRVTPGDSSLTSLSVCKQQCGELGNLWPQPSGILKIGKQLTAVDVWSIAIGDGLDPTVYRTLNDAFELFRTKQRSKARNPDGSPLYESSGKRLLVVLNTVDARGSGLELTTDESYELKIDTIEDGAVRATITANTFYGTRHALETLNQLILVDDLRKEIRVPSTVYITDKPAYPYRGVLIDTSRSFVTIEALKRTIDAMGASKLNTLHWHITDSHSFPFESKSFPELTRLGAYSAKHVYTEKEIGDLVEYARVRGVRVVPELDAPAHVGEGWEFAPGTLVCFKANPWRDFCVEPPCGQLDPTNEQVYEILGGIYSDMIRSFNPTIFHMGGDEVNFKCWNTSQTIQQWFSARNLSNATDDSFNDIWDHFQTKALDKLVSANGGKELPVVIWTSSLTGAGMVDKYLDPKKYIIQIWTKGDDDVIRELASKKYKLIFSNYDALYFDCGYGAWVGTGNNWCSPYIGWQKVYDNDPRTLLRNLGVTDAESLSLALGAEAALWTEQADSNSIDSKIWPRAAAMAERLWSDPESNWQAAESRFLEHRERLVNLGVFPDSIEPQWCVLNQGYCY